jgi:hypothetical protein
MKTPPFSVRWFGLAVAALALALTGLARSENARIPFSEIGAKATADYQGDALGITATPEGTRLRCGFQKLEGRATPEGLWLESTVPGGGEFHLVATTVHREVSECGSLLPFWNEPAPPESGRGLPQSTTLSRWCPRLAVSSEGELPTTGTVSVEDKLVRFTRPGVTEEYSVSVDGVRQDFVIAERPAGTGDLRVELALTGARAEAAAYGAKVILEGSGRALAYSRLRATDATGQELRARLEVDQSNAESRKQKAEMSESLLTSTLRRVATEDGPAPAMSETPAPALVVIVEDAEAVYPVRIDPTFSDANWVSLNPSILGADLYVTAIAVDGSGNVYVGGWFTVIGRVVANYIAEWNGSAWSVLGAGMDSGVYALALSGTTLYAGGEFTKAGGVTANCIAKWDGSAWSALGTGTDSGVYALALSGTTLYAGGEFTTAGGVAADCIAKWDGSAWSALGTGMASGVYALALSGTTLYAGGNFVTAGGVAANCIAKWDGSAWSALGAGVDMRVEALVVSGTTLYAGGDFTTAGGVTANCIAKWNGSAWSALGSGMGDFSPGVFALAVSGTTLYAGGDFTTAGGVAANYVAKWNGSVWSALGSGMDSDVHALAVSGTTLYAGGFFYTAGGATVASIAKWNGSAWSALGSGMSYPTTVSALAVSGTTLYAGGFFVAAGGVTANHIAAWDGSAWSALGSGMNKEVDALAADGSGHLFVGGHFSLAGTNVSPFIAQANIGTGVSGGQFGNLAYSRTTGFSCTFSDATIGQPYRIQSCASLAAGSWTNLTNFTYTGPMVISDRSAAAGPKKFYRAVSP